MTDRNCKWCGAFTGHIPEHPCRAFRVEPELPAKPSPSVSEFRNTEDGLKRYREAIR